MSSQGSSTFSVPVGSRLSQGIELEFLVAYLLATEVDPDKASHSKLAPVLRLKATDELNIDAIEISIQKHIRATLRDYGIRVRDPNDINDPDIPLHLLYRDQWEVDSDVTVSKSEVENELDSKKTGKYRWYGVELRSPAGWDVPDAYEEIRFVVNLIKAKYRVRANVLCGFHIHVANGPWYLDARTLKRLGAFLFAADPMLSRLHAPWRRLGTYSKSIRYSSRLACWKQLTPADVEQILEENANTSGVKFFCGNDIISSTMPALSWSDRSREEADFGGMSEWKEYADERVIRGPHLTISERPASPEQFNFGEMSENTTSAPPSPPPILPGDDDVDDTESGAYFRRFRKLMETPGFRVRCVEKFRHGDPLSLTHDEMHTLLLSDRCEYLFGHTNVNGLSKNEWYQLVTACAPYVDTLRSVWVWDPSADAFVFKDSKVGADLAYPRPLELEPINAKHMLERWSTLATNQKEKEGEKRSSEDERELAGDKNRLKRTLNDRVNELVVQPTFPYWFLENLYNQPRPNPDRSDSIHTATHTMSFSSDSSGGFNPPAQQALEKGFDENAILPGVSMDPSSSPVSSHNVTGGDTWSEINNNDNNPAVEDSSLDLSTISSPFVLSPPPIGGRVQRKREDDRICKGPRLHPHNPHKIPEKYKEFISHEEWHMTKDMWEQIEWLPHPTDTDTSDDGGPPDPRGGQQHEPGGRTCFTKRCQAHVATDTRSGLVTLLGGSGRNTNEEYNDDDDDDEFYDDGEEEHRQVTIPPPPPSAAGIAALLGPTDIGTRLNYNFAAYDISILGQGHERTNKRTIEFREAGGTLDADEIIALTRVAVGVVRFCRDATPLRFMRVVEMVVRQEERARRRRERRRRPGAILEVVEMREGEDEEDGDKGEGEFYDVADLLEDICLWAEATTFRRLEEMRGPPR